MDAAATTHLTIGKLAKAAGVGVETIRYYQQRNLLPVPASSGAYRYYPVALGQRIRFIKRAQELGFSLDEVAELLSLEDGLDRQSIRQIAGQRLDEIRSRMADLQRMQQALSHLITTCEHTGKEQPCPIIDTLAADRH
ncbi:MerR family transcriptional regulator, mercuric resistance operon regulatory protein [Rhodoferax sp. OV413]|uniref:MerR family transcriptional regulator n=1 Tax=Rhodoferax sp. OV413 TaxID=1855285 RepID=UPI00088DEA33|nr:MerR family transcriptional regulator [Rhodoferax sp. OV413]SDN93158.1 MerR family transcriptional regulator, mercuric resistance operon regulatory protein [Rhodoferax sp. OV413]